MNTYRPKEFAIACMVCDDIKIIKDAVSRIAYHSGPPLVGNERPVAHPTILRSFTLMTIKVQK